MSRVRQLQSEPRRKAKGNREYVMQGAKIKQEIKIDNIKKPIAVGAILALYSNRLFYLRQSRSFWNISLKTLSRSMVIRLRIRCRLGSKA